ncbi:MAG TPA: thioredoxin domain-containing protein [Chloroflexi bacterium]|nr:thioredoxin domain-containing protein [Chloroflexota bacterium]
MANRLKHEASPYLLQHAENPVDWYPWGEEALARARAEDKPIFLSIGYSSCHWCHVMARESFDDMRVAAFLNAHFISIKVDREERPDIDRVYMSALQALTGSGGWPLSVFLTPDGKPFYGGTYFPANARYGMPSFMEVLRTIQRAWRERRQELEAGGTQLVETLRKHMAPGRLAECLGRRGDSDEALLQEAGNTLVEGVDRLHGGWGNGPKFPHPMTLEFLMRRFLVSGDHDLLVSVRTTLDAMARGGIYDQLGGGFHRYAVDDHWVVPHFEKMLYDNALLARVYLHAWQMTDEPLYRLIVEETLDYVLREMMAPEGGFYATQDADAAGQEGGYYLWTAFEVDALLDEDAPLFSAVYRVSEQGNFEGKNILTLEGDLEQRQALEGARQLLLEARRRRPQPAVDKKVLASWNGLMIAALAEAGKALMRPDYLLAADDAATFVLEAMRGEDGRLKHAWKEGVAWVEGYLEDYTHMAEGLLALYETTFEARWYTAARALMDIVLERFAASTGFYDTSADHETLFVRPRELEDNAVPSGNAMAALVLARLATLAQEPRYEAVARESVATVRPLMAEYPLGFSQWLIALDYLAAPPVEIAIAGEPDAEDTRTLLDVGAGGYAPHRVLAVGGSHSAEVPLLAGKEPVDHAAAAYVCSGATCHPPVTEPDRLRELIS